MRGVIDAALHHKPIIQVHADHQDQPADIDPSVISLVFDDQVERCPHQAEDGSGRAGGNRHAVNLGVPDEGGNISDQTADEIQKQKADLPESLLQNRPHIIQQNHVKKQVLKSKMHEHGGDHAVVLVILQHSRDIQGTVFEHQHRVRCAPFERQIQVYNDVQNNQKYGRYGDCPVPVHRFSPFDGSYYTTKGGCFRSLPFSFVFLPRAKRLLFSHRSFVSSIGKEKAVPVAPCDCSCSRAMAATGAIHSAASSPIVQTSGTKAEPRRWPEAHIQARPELLPSETLVP